MNWTKVTRTALALNTGHTPLSTAAAHALVRPLARSQWSADYYWGSIERALAGWSKDYGLNLDPDFQRGRTWSPRQQAHYIENALRGVIPPETMVIQFNAPHWDDDGYLGELPREVQIIDGLQRLTTVIEYLDGKVLPFGRSVQDFEGTPFDVRRRTGFRFRFAMHTFATKRELLQHYLDLNSGGTPHSASEIERVQAMLTA